MKQKEEDKEHECRECGSGLVVLHDWVTMHGKESLWHCYDCDAVYQAFYKLDKIVLLKPEID